MNIKEAKEQIENTITAYLMKNEFGDYKIPIQKQRPVFLVGPPGIGKTAIIEQIATKMGVGLLTYSMTHHTRQSALGLPFIEHKVYQGKEFDISEYTMSEIVASVYELMENTGVNEGILFLDEINCVSETLTPIMLQFLQYKVFGSHKVPEGWVIVTAGNPPEYNNSVREFDIVTLDRLKRIDVEPNLGVWKEYIGREGVHAAVSNYLEIEKADFYKVEATVSGKTFVTARGWDDLSTMITLYEEKDIPVDEKLICQYIQNPKIADKFASYYDLFNKYRSDYQIPDILAGKASTEIKGRLKQAAFDERLSVIGLILDAITNEIKNSMDTGDILQKLLENLKMYGTKFAEGKGKKPYEILDDFVHQNNQNIERGRTAGNISDGEIFKIKTCNKFLTEQSKMIRGIEDGNEAFQEIKKDFDGRVKKLQKESKKTGKQLNNIFVFFEEVFGDGQEMLVFVTELTSSYYASRYIAQYGCEKYFQHNKELLLYERQQEIETVLSDLKL
jgi:hypothetical protein